jgi:hypothetical protein
MMTTPRRSFLSLGLAACLWTTVAAGLSASEALMSPLDDPPSPPHYLPLPGKAVGLVVFDARGVLEREGRYGPADAACFARGEASYRWFYVPARGGVQGELQSFGVGEPGGKVQEFDNMVMATPRSLKPWGVVGPFALVELEVNKGQGSRAEEQFAATSLRVLDGSAQYPIRVAEAIAAVRNRHEAALRARKGLEEEMDKARRQALNDGRPTGPREQTTWVYATWLPSREVVRVELRTEIRDGAYSYARGIEPIGPDNPRSDVAPPEKESPRHPGIRHGTSYGIVLGAVYEISKDGNVGPAQPRTMRSFLQKLPPPGSAAPGGAAPPR